MSTICYIIKAVKLLHVHVSAEIQMCTGRRLTMYKIYRTLKLLVLSSYHVILIRGQ
jgi:hypothetical protein